MGHWLRLLNGYKDNSLIHVDITDNTGKFKEKVCHSNFETASQGSGLRFTDNRDVFKVNKFNMYAAIALRLLSKDIYSQQ